MSPKHFPTREPIAAEAYDDDALDEVAEPVVDYYRRRETEAAYLLAHDRPTDPALAARLERELAAWTVLREGEESRASLASGEGDRTLF